MIAEIKIEMTNGIIKTYDSNLPAEYLQLFLNENQNVWNEEKFFKFVNSFEEIKKMFFVNKIS